MDRKVEIESAAMDMMLKMLIETSPDDRKAIFEAPLAISRLTRKMHVLLKLITKAPTEDNQDAVIASQIIAMLNGFSEQIDIFLTMHEQTVDDDTEQGDE